MICPLCKKRIKAHNSRTVRGVAYHKGCAVWGFLPRKFYTTSGEVLDVDVVRLNVRSAIVRVKGTDKDIRVKRSSNKLRRS